MMKKTIGMFCITLICCLSVFAPIQAAEETQVLRVVAPWKAKGMNLAKSGFIYSRMGCVEMLTVADASGHISGLLAESWQVAQDGLTWTFNLRPGITFHDHTFLTAEAAAHSLNIALASKGVLSKATVEKITASGPLTLEIRTAKPFSALPAYVAHYSAGIISSASFDEAGDIKTLYGTGQYMLTDHEGGSLFRFQAYPGYWGEKPRIEKTEYHAVSKGETRGFMMKAGQAEMAFTLSPVDARQLKQSSDITVETLSIPRTRLMLLNCQLPFFSDIKVRQAISLAIDRQGIAAALLRNPPSAATQLLPPTAAMWHDAALKGFLYDPKKAAALLSQSGWKPGSDGILVKDGKQLSFDLMTYAARPMLPPVATAIQDQLRQVGIEMNIKVVESSLIPEKNIDGTLQAALVARNFGQIPDAVGTIYGDYGPHAGSWGAMGWQSPELNRMLSEYLATFDPGRSQTLRKEILGLLQQELPVIPITWYEHIVAYSNSIEGVNIDPFEIQSYVKGVRWK
ncbi:MAG: ABC transporter substrate-binding protein [Desulfobacterium sp.]